MTTSSLPITPGQYRDSGGDLWELDDQGTWLLDPYGAPLEFKMPEGLAEMAFYAPFTPEVEEQNA